MHTTDRRRARGVRILLIGTLAVTALGLSAGRITATAQAPAEGRRHAVVTVHGMQCPFCAYGIKKRLGKVPGVTRVDVELAKNQAIVTVGAGAKVTDAQIQQAIRKAGFTPGQIEWRAGDPVDKTPPVKGSGY